MSGGTLHGQSLADALGVKTASAARRAVRREGIPHVRLGRRLIVRASALDAWLCAHEEITGARQAAPPVPKLPELTRALLKKGTRR